MGHLGNWDLVVPELARRFRVVAYDRKGHNNSERPTGQGSYRQDVDDLAALIERSLRRHTLLAVTGAPTARRETNVRYPLHPAVRGRRGR